MSDDVVIGGSNDDQHERREVAQIRPLRSQEAALELEVLKVRDWAAAQGVLLGDLRRQLELAKLDDANHRAHIARLEAALGEASKRARQVERLRRELEDVRASTTWRIGRLATTPVRVVKRLLRRG